MFDAPRTSLILLEAGIDRYQVYTCICCVTVSIVIDMGVDLVLLYLVDNCIRHMVYIGGLTSMCSMLHVLVLYS